MFIKIYKNHFSFQYVGKIAKILILLEFRINVLFCKFLSGNVGTKIFFRGLASSRYKS